MIMLHMSSRSYSFCLNSYVDLFDMLSQISSIDQNLGDATHFIELSHDTQIKPTHKNFKTLNIIIPK